MDEAVQDVVAETQTETVPVETPGDQVAGDQQQQPADQTGTETEGAVEPKHPLEPGGDRFKEVWARAKAAEERAKQAEERARQVEIEKARLEGERKAEAEAKQKQATEREYSWDELENFIADGKITRAQASAYKEERLTKRLEAKYQAELDAKLNVTHKVSTIRQDLDKYIKAIPSVTQAGTQEHAKYQHELAYLVNTLGYPDTLPTQLAAARAAFGPPEAVESAAKAKATTRQERPGFMDTATQRPVQPKSKDPIDTMPQDQKEFYTKLIKSGRFGRYQGVITDAHWAEVKKELSWQRGKS